jgi:dehydrodolichyl diphosphate syntase complex subunit NUS1
MVATKETRIYRNSMKKGGPALDPEQRENLLKPYLPSPLIPSEITNRSLTRPLRHFIKTQIHVLVFTVIHTLFSLYIRARQIYHILIDRLFALLYYHHRAPELIKQDVRGLSRLPKHLSVILELKGEDRGLARLDELMDEVAEISAWCACVGIPILSIYEKTGGCHFPG